MNFLCGTVLFGRLPCWGWLVTQHCCFSSSLESSRLPFKCCLLLSSFQLKALLLKSEWSAKCKLPGQQ